jgi:hypothetical protein
VGIALLGCREYVVTTIIEKLDPRAETGFLWLGQ